MPDSPLQANRYKIFTVGAIGTFMATLDGSIVNVALPTIARELNTTIDIVAWVVLAYSLTLISLMLLFGAWTEKRGYEFAYKFGFYFFTIGSLLCSIAPTIHWLIFSRVVQAVGTAMFAGIGPGMTTTVFPPEQRGKWIGIMVMMVAGGFMVGPPLGGVMLKLFSWHSIFVINLPIGVIGLALVYRYFRYIKTPKSDRRINPVGAVSISVGLVTLVLALSFIDEYPLTDPRIWGTALISVIALTSFFRVEMNPDKALIGLALFRDRVFTSSMLAALMHFMAVAGVLVLIPFYLERVKGLEPSEVGLFLIILPVLMFVLSPSAGKLSDRIGYRALTSAGMISMGFGQLMLAQFEPASPIWYIIATLVVVGLGTGLFSTPNSSAMMGAAPETKRAVASGILATNRNIGMSVGVALATTIFTYFQRQYAGQGDDATVFAASYEPVAYVAAGLAAVGLVFCLIRGEPTTDRAPGPPGGHEPVPPV